MTTGGDVDGFCYLRWFEQYGAIASARRALGPYPRLREVLLHLFPLVKDVRTSFFGLMNVGAFTLHVTRSHRIDFLELVECAVRNGDYRVGSRTTKSGVDYLSALLNAGYDPIKTAQDALVKNIRNDPEVGRQLVGDLLDMAQVDALKPKRGPPVVIHQQLTHKEQLLLKRYYGNYDIIFSDHPIVTEHGYYAASRVLARRKCMDILMYKPGEAHSRGKHCALKEVGANIMDILKPEEENIHGCAPILAPIPTIQILNN